MFIVSRKSEESVVVDGFSNPERSLKVTVLEVKGGRVKLGIEVNAGTPVHRSLPQHRVCTVVGHDRAMGRIEVLRA